MQMVMGGGEESRVRDEFEELIGCKAWHKSHIKIKEVGTGDDDDGIRCYCYSDMAHYA